MVKLGWPMECSYQEGQPPREPVFAGRAFKGILVWLSFLTLFLPFTALAYQRALSAGKDTPKCSKQSEFETLVARGKDSQIPLPARENALKEAVNICPQNPDGYEGLAALFLQQQDFRQALNLVHGGLKAVPGNANLLLELGTILLSSGHPEQALLVFKGLPESAKTEFYLGQKHYL